MGDNSQLTPEDFKNILWKPNSKFDVLVVVSEVGLEKYEIERERLERREHPISVANPAAIAKGKRSVTVRKKSQTFKYSFVTFPIVHSSKVEVGTMPPIKEPLPLVRKTQTVRPKRLVICDSDEENGRESKTIKKTIKNTIKKTAILEPLPLPPPELPAQFRERIERMNGYEVALVIQKHLYTSDVSEKLCRFSIPTRQIRTEFLREDEKEFLDNRNGKEVPEIKALLIEPSSTAECTVSIRKWEMPKESGRGSSIFNLVSTWRSIVARNTLEQGMIVQPWAFRVESRLCFALVKVGGGDRDDGSSCSSSSSSDSGFSDAAESSITQHNFGQQD